MSEYQGKHRRTDEQAESAVGFVPLHRRDDEPESAVGFVPLADPVRVARTRRQSRLLLILGTVLIAAALVIAGFIVWRYLGARTQYEAVNEAAGLPTDPAEVTALVNSEGDELAINWEALRKINPDIVGWILIPDTRISYPIVQATDNDYYLTHLSDRSTSTVGAIFLDCANSTIMADRNNMIYGHNMLDGSMFADLEKFVGQDYFDGHREVIIATPSGVYHLQTIGVVVCDGSAKLRQFAFAEEASFAAYLAELHSQAVVVDEAAWAQTGKLYCFATCTDLGNSKRTILLATPVEKPAAANGH